MAIYRGTGGAGDADNDATVTEVTRQATNAAASADNAASSASSASSSATSASNSASTATTKASEASSSAAAADSSESNASTSASTASTAATNAQTAQTAAELAETNAETAETNAESSASAASTSASNASTSETNAASSASNAKEWATSTEFVEEGELAYWSAKTAATASKTFASHPEDIEYSVQLSPLFGVSGYSALHYAAKANDSATAASTSATNAATSETNADDSATAAASSASSASTSASTATTKASEASTSATNAATSETNAATSETNAASSASAASTSASNASTSATDASNSASAAATALFDTTILELNASNSASAASTSASNAATSETNAQTAADTALSALDNFDDRYLGQKTSDPTLDNDGDALVAGALYFNTTDDVMKVYDGSAWVAAYASLSGTLVAVNNLSDVASVSASRTNLGLGTAATTASTDYATAAQGALADSAVQSVVEDTTPQLGGNLDLNSSGITGTGYISIDGGIALNGQTGYGNIEVGGDLGAFIDLKAPNSDDYDGRLITTGTGLNITSGSGGVTLSHQNSTKLSTTATGVDVTGTITADGLTTSGDINFGDVNKAIFGVGSDLQIYHTGGASVIRDSGTGSLYIDGSSEIFLRGTSGFTNMIKAIDGAEVELYHNNAPKLSTTATGIDVTGTVTADGLTVTTGAVGTTAGDEKDFALLGTTGGSQVRLRETRHTDGTTWTTTETKLHYSVNDNANKQMWLSFYNPDNITTNNVIRFGEGDNNEWVRIDNGNVGIGTSSPAVNLHVSSTGTPTFRIQDADGSDYYAQISQATGSTIFDTRFGASNGAFIFRGLGGGTADEYMRITSAGNVGIGTTSPSTALDVNGTVTATTVDLGDWTITESAGVLKFAHSGTDKMKLDSSGNLTVVGDVTAFGSI